MVKDFEARIGPARDITEMDAHKAVAAQVQEWLNENTDVLVTSLDFKVYKSLAYTMQETNIRSYYYVVDAVALIIYEAMGEPKGVSLSV